MKTYMKAFLSVSMISILLMYSFLAYADGGVELVYFNCQPNHSLYVKGLFLFDITPVLDNRTLQLGKLQPEQGMQECQLSPTDKVVVQINGNPDRPRNNNVTIMMNGKYIDDFTYENPNKSYTYIFQVPNRLASPNEPIRIEKIESVETEARKTLAPVIAGQ